MDNKIKCINCNSGNTEELTTENYYCCNCNSIFKKIDYKILIKRNRKLLLAKNEKLNMSDIVNNSIYYIYGMGFNLVPEICMDLKNSSRGAESKIETLHKLSVLESCAETHVGQIKKHERTKNT